MDIFSGNRRLEEFVMYSLDWGLFLRHNDEAALAPYLFMWDGTEMRINVLMTDGNPLEYAYEIIKQETRPFQQFVVGMEGYLRDAQNNRVDAVIVHGFDVTQDKGVILAQQFQPKDKGGFRRIDKVTFMGNPDLPIPKNTTVQSDFTVQEPGFTAINLNVDNMTVYRVVISHDNPSVITDTVKRFLRSKFGGPDASQLSGEIKVDITPQDRLNTDMLQFLLKELLQEELGFPVYQNWATTTGRSFRISAYYQDTELCNSASITPVPTAPAATASPTGPNPYAIYSESELKQEFNRIIRIPNAATNEEALLGMSNLIREYESRGIPMPNARPAEEKWYDKIWLVALLCFLFIPLGLVAVWKNTKIPQWLKIVLTIGLGGWFLTRFYKVIRMFML